MSSFASSSSSSYGRMKSPNLTADDLLVCPRCDARYMSVGPNAAGEPDRRPCVLGCGVIYCVECVRGGETKHSPKGLDCLRLDCDRMKTIHSPNPSQDLVALLRALENAALALNIRESPEQYVRESNQYEDRQLCAFQGCLCPTQIEFSTANSKLSLEHLFSHRFVPDSETIKQVLEECLGKVHQDHYFTLTSKMMFGIPNLCSEVAKHTDATMKDIQQEFPTASTNSWDGVCDRRSYYYDANSAPNNYDFRDVYGSSSSSSKVEPWNEAHWCGGCHKKYGDKGRSPDDAENKPDHTPRRLECGHIRCADCLQGQPAISVTKKLQKQTECDECGEIVSKVWPHAKEIMAELKMERVAEAQRVTAEQKQKRDAEKERERRQRVYDTQMQQRERQIAATAARAEEKAAKQAAKQQRAAEVQRQRVAEAAEKKARQKAAQVALKQSKSASSMRPASPSVVPMFVSVSSPPMQQASVPPQIHYVPSSSSAPAPTSAHVRTKFGSRPSPWSVFTAGWSAKKVIRVITLSREENIRYNAAFQQVRSFMETYFKPKPPVEKVGSFAKNTAIIDSDIDIVVRFPGIKTKEGFKQAAKHLHDAVLNNPLVFAHPTFNGWVVSFQAHGISVDLLPAPIVQDASEHLAVHGEQEFLSACGSVGNRKFIQAQCGKYKLYRAVLQCVKYWARLHNWSVQGRITQPKSFLLELLTLDVLVLDAKHVENGGTGKTKEQLFADVLALLAQKRRRLILHSAEHPTREALVAKGSNILDGFIDDLIMSDLQFHIVVDPMNPHNDVASALEDASLVRKYAKQTLGHLDCDANLVNEL